MKYATWVLTFNDPKYGIGPEGSIVAQGGTAVGAFAGGDITNGAKILGYFTGQPTGLEQWAFTELTQEEALDFVKAIDLTAYLDEQEKILVELTDNLIS
jgi:hypothetical protein